MSFYCFRTFLSVASHCAIERGALKVRTPRPSRRALNDHTMSQFSVCVPDYVRGLVWCRHLNGNWAPPFQMKDAPKEWKAKDPSKTDESNAKS